VKNAERDYFSQGLAIGFTDLKRDVVIWHFRDERYETGRGAFLALVAPVEAVRAAAKEGK
jgi:hypothetical protein